MKDIIKACLAIIFVIILAFFVFFEGKTEKDTSKNEFIPQGRIDVHVPQEKKDKLNVIFNGQKVKKASWTNDKEWYTVQTQSSKIIFSVKSNKNENITIELRGPYEKSTEEKTMEHWVRFTSLTIDGKKVLTQPQEVWHDSPYKYNFKATKGKTYTIEGIWEEKK